MSQAQAARPTRDRGANGLPGRMLWINATVLSDLFFNYEHPNMDRLMKGAEHRHIKDAELHAALALDAEDFLGTLTASTANGANYDGVPLKDMAQRLASDFLERT